MIDRQAQDNGRDAPPNPRELDSESADLGVLLVHGIGQSRSSDTLVHFGEPLVAWISDWIGDAAAVEVVDAVLGVEAQDPSTRPHTRLKITVPGPQGEPGVSSEWLIAESWWAESFASPSFGELVDWGLRIVPLTLFFHFSRRANRALTAMRDTWNARPRRYRPLAARGGRWLVNFATLLLAILLAPLLMTLLLLMLIGGLIPIPRVRSLIGRLQRGLAVTVGDSYSLLGPKIGSGAIYGRVRRDLDWLTERVRTTAIVAHSQGAAIAYRVASRDRSGTCRLLVTFGAGIRKLGQIRRIKAGSSGWIGWVSLALVCLVLAVHLSRARLGLGGGILLAAAVPLAWAACSALLGLALRLCMKLVSKVRKRPPPVLSERWSIGLGLASAAVALAPAVVWLPGSLASKLLLVFLYFIAWAWIFGAVKVAGDASGGLMLTLPETGRASPPGEVALDPDLRWVDLYSTHDPVPNGPIFDGIEVDPLTGEGETHGLRTIETVNRASTVVDHSNYWRNREGFTAVVAGELARCCGLDFEEARPFDTERLLLARHRRAWRGRWLRRSRYIALTCAAAIWISGRASDHGVRLQAWLVDFVGGLPLLGGLLRPVLPETVSASAVTEIAVIALGGALALTLTSLAWNRWDTVDREVLVGRGDYRVPDGKLPPATLLHMTWLTIIASTGALVLGATPWRWWVYLLILVGIFLASAVIGAIDPFAGNLRTAWTKLLVRLGASEEEAAESWRQRIHPRALVLIDPVEQDGGTIWDSGLTLGFRGSATSFEEVAKLASRDEAVAWGRQRAATVMVAEEGRYVLAQEERGHEEA